MEKEELIKLVKELEVKFNQLIIDSKTLTDILTKHIKDHEEENW